MSTFEKLVAGGALSVLTSALIGVMVLIITV